MEDIIHRLAKNVRKERIKQGLTQADLAEKADLHSNYIGLIERAQCNISISTYRKLCNIIHFGLVGLSFWTLIQKVILLGTRFL